MTLITWTCLRYVQEMATILGPQNRTQGSCAQCFLVFIVESLFVFVTLYTVPLNLYRKFKA